MEAELKFEHAVVGLESEHQVHVMVELRAPSAPQAAERAPVDVALVVDRSGSMGEASHGTWAEEAA